MGELERHVNSHSHILALPGKAGVDAVIAMSPENFAFVSGAFVLTIETIPARQAFAVIPSTGEPFSVICSIELETMRDESWIEELVTYTEFAEVPVAKLAQAMRDRGLDRGKIGIDLDYIPQTSFGALVAELPHVEFVNTTGIVATARAIKSPAEVERLEFAAKGTHQAVIEAMAESRLGESEKTMAGRISKRILDNGADTTFFMCFCSGPRTPLVHGGPTDRTPQEGEIVRFDLGGRYGAFYSDFARTYSAGSPTAVQRDTYRKLVEIHKETISAIRPGIAAEEIFAICKAGFERRQLAFHMPHVGHGFGVEVHEAPMMRPGDTTRLASGMVVNIEPICIDPHGSLYHVEDLVEVTDTGCRLLTLGFPQDEIPEIGTPVPS